MIILTTFFKDLQTNLQDISKVDIVEVRVDFLKSIDFELIKNACGSCPILWTVRSQEEGGKLTGPLREKLLKKIIAMRPAYLDLEYHRDLPLLLWVQKHSPETKVILSCHSQDFFEESFVEQKLKEMKQYAAWKYKIVMKTHSTIDALKMLILMKKHSDFIGITIGEKGRLSRILGPLVGQDITYCSCESRPPYGQISLEKLISQYRFVNLNEQTRLYGLVGDNLAMSPGERVYNAFFKHIDLNALYVNFQIEKSDWDECICLLKKLAVQGLSITAPFKKLAAKVVEKMTFLNEPAMNTLHFSNKGLIGRNTDGEAALKIINESQKFQHKDILIIGAGGAAEAIAHTLYHKKYSLTFLNRNPEKARALALKFDGKVIEKSDGQKAYSILIRTAPIALFKIARLIKPGALVIDLLMKQDKSIDICRAKSCLYYTGEQFWLQQGAEQISEWLKMPFKYIKNKLQATINL